MSKVGTSDSKNTLYCSFCGKSQHEVRKLIAGTWTGNRNFRGGVKDNIVVLTPLNTSVSADVAKLLADKKQAIAAGTLVPFAGPLQDSTGVPRIAAGSVLTDQQLMTINWYVAGVEGAVPK